MRNCVRLLLSLYTLLLSTSVCGKTFKVKEVVIATWNIGHFSMGTKPYSIVLPEEAAIKSKAYLSFIRDSIRADILCVNEYSQVFCKQTNVSDIMTNDIMNQLYPFQHEGHQVGYSCNSLFSHIKVSKHRSHSFICNTDKVDVLPRAANYYYTTSLIKVGNKRVTFVCVHLISGAPQLCQAEIVELLTLFKNKKRVVMCGDWNTSSLSLLIKAGFRVANDGTFVTYSPKSLPLDNIVTKGLKIDNVRTVNTDLSDHMPLICRIKLN